MGLSASQARYLQLTARKSNIEFEAQQTTQAKMMLANEIEGEAKLWNEKMNTKHLYYAKDGIAGDTSNLPRLTYQAVTSQPADGGLGMRVVDASGRMVVPSLPNPLPEGKTADDYVIDPKCNQADYFEEQLFGCNWRMQEANLFANGQWTDVSVDGSAYIYQGIDEEEMTAGLADYEAKVERLQNQDKQFDMRLDQLKNEQKAIETEMDSVKKVIDKNIEETFKTFA